MTVAFGRRSCRRTSLRALRKTNNPRRQGHPPTGDTIYRLTIQTSDQGPKSIWRPFGSGFRCRRFDHHEVDTQIAKLAEDSARSVCVDDDMVELSEICELEQSTASKLGVVEQQDACLG